MKIKKVCQVELTPTVPFDFDSTFHKPDHFTSGDNYWEKGARWQTWWWERKDFGLKFENKGTVDKPKVIVTVYALSKPDKKLLDSLINEVKYRYNLDLDLGDFYKHFSKDEVLSPIIKKWRGMRPGHPSSLYEYLIIGIVLQNATVRRSIQMFKTLLEKYGKPLEFDGKKLWCFWSPGALKNVTEE